MDEKKGAGHLHYSNSGQRIISSSDAKGKIPPFAVTVVRPSRDEEERLSFSITDDGLRANGITVDSLLRFAYGIESDQIAGLPQWALTNSYDVQAKVDPDDISAWKNLNTQQQRESVRAILADRFRLRFHSSSRVKSVDELTPSKDGGKLLVSHKDSQSKTASAPAISVTSSSVRCEHVSMSAFASVLSSELGRTVVDKTNESGTFSFKLNWNSQADTGAEDPSGLPGILTALREQLGLHIVSKRSEVQVLMVDSITKPTTN